MISVGALVMHYIGQSDFTIKADYYIVVDILSAGPDSIITVSYKQG